jgi:hypothetical protein
VGETSRSDAALEVGGPVVNLRFIGSVAVISPDPSASRHLYVDALGLPLAGEPDGYLHSENIEGSKSFGIWPLSQAAQVCFGTTTGRRIVLFRRRASSSRLRTPTLSRPPPTSCSAAASPFCMARGSNRGDRR